MARAISTILVLLVIFAASRGLIRSLPGDPIETLMAETATQVPREELLAELGLGKPYLESLVHDLGRAARGDLGRSILTREPVGPLVGSRFLHTLGLASLSLAMGFGASLVLALLACGAIPGLVQRWSDRFCTGYGALTAALPTAWLGPLLIWLLAVRIPIFPLGGHIFLPALTLAIVFAGFWSRLVRERVRESLEEGSARAARARGIAEWKIVIKYGFMPGAGALLAYLGTQFGALLGGAFVTEVIFAWPGIGSLLVESVQRRDYVIVEAAVFVTAAAAFVGTAVGDWLQSRIDPRVRS